MKMPRSLGTLASSPDTSVIFEPSESVMIRTPPASDSSLMHGRRPSSSQSEFLNCDSSLLKLPIQDCAPVSSVMPYPIQYASFVLRFVALSTAQVHRSFRLLSGK